MKARIRPVLLCCLLVAAAGQLSAQDGSLGKVILSYTLERLERRGSNQLAVWIEDAEGGYAPERALRLCSCPRRRIRY
jgi:hypothetical protein